MSLIASPSSAFVSESTAFTFFPEGSFMYPPSGFFSGNALKYACSNSLASCFVSFGRFALLISFCIVGYMTFLFGVVAILFLGWVGNKLLPRDLEGIIDWLLGRR